MMLFSERNGLKNFRTVIQKDNIDEQLKNKLWNVYHECLWEKYRANVYSYNYDLRGSNLGPLFVNYWHSYFKKTLDTLPERLDYATPEIKKYFFSCHWYEIFDFIEFTAKNLPVELLNDFTSSCNKVLESELSAYRLIDNNIVEITSEIEIESIENALDNSSNYKNVQTHLSIALQLLSDRKSPDYRNSIKESISAVEAIVKNIIGKDKATLGEALKVLEKENNLHPALQKSLSALYGYTSATDGIRHSLMEEDNLTFVDAKFMLVACTAFINYIMGKIDK